MNYKKGAFCIAFENPVNSYATVDDTLDSIYGLAIIREDEKDGKVLISYIDESRENRLLFSNEIVDTQNVIPVLYYNEDEESSIRRFFKDKAKGR